MSNATNRSVGIPQDPADKQSPAPEPASGIEQGAAPGSVKAGKTGQSDSAEPGTIGIGLPDYHDHPGVVVGGGVGVIPAMEAYKSLRRKLINIRVDRGVRSVAITSAAPSEGKTLTAFNLAYCCAQLENIRVLLIDADMRTQALSRLFKEPPAVGLLEVLKGTISCNDAIVSTGSSNLFVLGAGSAEDSPAELLSTGKWSQVIAWAHENFDLVVVDSVPAGVVVDFDLTAAGCEGILLVVRAMKTSRHLLKNVLNQIDTKKIVGVVWNGARRSRKANEYLYGYMQQK